MSVILFTDSDFKTDVYGSWKIAFYFYSGVFKIKIPCLLLNWLVITLCIWVIFLAALTRTTSEIQTWYNISTFLFLFLLL